ncbi:MAG: high-potential iron-sulfur protein [Betaproteobacteria bacterium]|jgi:High potential iron-sulfur protein
MTSRRDFFINISLMGTAIAGGHVFAQAANLSESDPQATALGYKADTTKVDQAKNPKHTATQVCKNCQLYVGKPTDAAGGCPLFAGKLVAANGWCTAYNKKSA